MPLRRLTPAAQQRLRGMRWRGNVRELENTIHRAVLLAAGTRDRRGRDRACAGAFRSGAADSRRCPPPAFGRHDGGRCRMALVGRRMEDVERDLILHTLGHTLGNRTHAATILGISIRALRNKLRDYAAQGMPVPPPPAGIAMPVPAAQLAV